MSSWKEIARALATGKRSGGPERLQMRAALDGTRARTGLPRDTGSANGLLVAVIVVLVAVVAAGSTYIATDRHPSTTQAFINATSATPIPAADAAQQATCLGASDAQCTSLTAFTPGKGEAGAPTPGDDYPTSLRAPHAQDSEVDPWGEYNRECTSWVAWALHSRNHFEMPFNANAIDWKAQAQQRGYRVDTHPAVGSVAWEIGGNHVAWVYAVSGSTVTIQEYNYDYHGDYHWRTVAESGFLYIHFRDLTSADSRSPAPRKTRPALQAAGGGTQLQNSDGTGLQGSSSGGTTLQNGNGGLSLQGTSAGGGGGSKPAPTSTQSPPTTPSTAKLTTPPSVTHTPTPAATNPDGAPTTHAAPPAHTAPATRGFFVEDDFYGGTWARTDPNNGTWYSKGSLPPNGAYWYPNGLGIAASCAEPAAGYVVAFGNGTRQTWHWWVRVTDGKWIPVAVLREATADGSQGLNRC